MVKSIFQFKICHVFFMLILSLFLLGSGIEEVFAIPVIGLDPKTGQRGLQEKSLSSGNENARFDVPDMTEAYARNVFTLKYSDREAYYMVIESMSDYEYAMYAGFEAMFEAQMTPTELAIAEDSANPAMEGLGEEYLMDVYDIDSEDVEDEGFAQYMFTLQETDADKYWDIIANMTDEQYEQYYGQHEYFQENKLYVSSYDMTAFVLDGGTFKTGKEIVLSTKDGVLQIPDNLMFLINSSAGSEYYIYGNDPSVVQIFNGNDSVDFVYTDECGVRIVETLYAEDTNGYLFESGEGIENDVPAKEGSDAHETK